MQVLKHGKYYRIATCRKCDCEFQFNKKEIKNYFRIDDAFGYYIDYDYIECPECGEQIILEERSVEI